MIFAARRSVGRGALRQLSGDMLDAGVGERGADEAHAIEGVGLVMNRDAAVSRSISQAISNSVSWSAFSILATCLSVNSGLLAVILRRPPW